MVKVKDEQCRWKAYEAKHVLSKVLGNAPGRDDGLVSCQSEKAGLIRPVRLALRFLSRQLGCKPRDVQDGQFSVPGRTRIRQVKPHQTRQGRMNQAGILDNRMPLKLEHKYATVSLPICTS